MAHVANVYCNWSLGCRHDIVGVKMTACSSGRCPSTTPTNLHYGEALKLGVEFPSNIQNLRAERMSSCKGQLASSCLGLRHYSAMGRGLSVKRFSATNPAMGFSLSTSTIGYSPGSLSSYTRLSYVSATRTTILVAPPPRGEVLRRDASCIFGASTPCTCTTVKTGTEKRGGTPHATE